MGDILCSFTSDIYETQSHRETQAAAVAAEGETVRASAAEKASALESKESGRSTESAPTPRIMASYDSLYEASQRGQCSEDGARETDGADSIADTLGDDE